VSRCGAGGLQEAVAALKEALVLPARYSHLLAAAPLRLRTGEVVGCGAGLIHTGQAVQPGQFYAPRSPSTTPPAGRPSFVTDRDFASRLCLPAVFCAFHGGCCRSC
jgi:hypothetical protein